MSINDDNVRAKACLSVFETSKLSMLSEDNWNFAMARQSLNRDTVTPAYDFAYRFALPINPAYLRLVEHDQCPTMEWSIEGQFILCDSDSLSIKYVGDVPASQFSNAFAFALSALIASQVCRVLDQDHNLGERLYQLHLDRLGRAKHIDALATKSQRVVNKYPRSYLGRHYLGRRTR